MVYFRDVEPEPGDRPERPEGSDITPRESTAQPPVDPPRESPADSADEAPPALLSAHAPPAEPRAETPVEPPADPPPVSDESPPTSGGLVMSEPEPKAAPLTLGSAQASEEPPPGVVMDAASAGQGRPGSSSLLIPAVVLGGVLAVGGMAFMVQQDREDDAPAPTASKSTPSGGASAHLDTVRRVLEEESRREAREAERRAEHLAALAGSAGGSPFSPAASPSRPSLSGTSSLPAFNAFGDTLARAQASLDSSRSEATGAMKMQITAELERMIPAVADLASAYEAYHQTPASSAYGSLEALIGRAQLAEELQDAFRTVSKAYARLPKRVDAHFKSAGGGMPKSQGPVRMMTRSFAEAIEVHRYDVEMLDREIELLDLLRGQWGTWAWSEGQGFRGPDALVVRIAELHGQTESLQSQQRRALSQADAN